MSARPVIDASASELDLAMTEGDLIRFNFLVPGEGSWEDATFLCQVKAEKKGSADVIATLNASVTDEDGNADFLIESSPVAALVEGTYWWDVQEVGGVTRFIGKFIVTGQVST